MKMQDDKGLLPRRFPADGPMPGSAARSRPQAEGRRHIGAWRRGAAIAAALLAAGAGTFVLVAQAQDAGPMRGGRGGDGAPMGMPMFAGPPGHLARRLDSLLDGLGTTDAQRSEVRRIAMAAATDLGNQRDAARGFRERAAQLLTAPAVDATAAESLRQEMLARQDQSSKRVMQAMLDIAGVLTPAQRARLGDRLRDRQAMLQDRMQRMQDHRQPQPPGGPGQRLQKP